MLVLIAICAQTAAVEVTPFRRRLTQTPYSSWRFWTVIGEPSAMNAERGG